MAVVDQGQNAPWVLALHSDQVGDTVDQNAGLARAGTCQDQHVGLFTLVRDDPRLRGISQGLDDCPPRLGRCLTAKLRASSRQPLLNEAIAVEGEVIL